MRYEEYRDVIRDELRQARGGLTWVQLKSRLGLPYKVPCPEWTRRLQEEIGLTRISGPGRAHIWQVPSPGGRRRSGSVPRTRPRSSVHASRKALSPII